MNKKKMTMTIDNENDNDNEIDIDNLCSEISIITDFIFHFACSMISSVVYIPSVVFVAQLVAP